PTTSTGARWTPAPSGRSARPVRCGCSNAPPGSPACSPADGPPSAAGGGGAGAVELVLQAAGQILGPEDVVTRGGAGQRIRGQDHRRAGPGGALHRPPFAVGVDQPGPVRPVLLAQVVHGRELFFVAPRITYH